MTATVKASTILPDLDKFGQVLLVLDGLARCCGAVDGVTGAQTVSVDGLPFERYAKVLADIEKAVAT